MRYENAIELFEKLTSKLRCRDCNQPMELRVSCCTDGECCGIEHAIRCSDSPYSHYAKEFWDLDTDLPFEFMEKLAEIPVYEEGKDWDGE